MISEKQAELARTFTGSTISAKDINKQFFKVSKSVVQERCLDIDAVFNEYDIEFNEAMPILKNSFKAIAGRTKIDPATLFCIYMDWKSKQ